MIFLQNVSPVNLLGFFSKNSKIAGIRNFGEKVKVTKTQVLVSPCLQINVAEMKINSDV